VDNVNVLRTGFYAPEFSLPDSEGRIFSLGNNMGDFFFALCFFPSNPNEKIRKYLKDLNGGLPLTMSNLEVKPVGICPEKISVAARLKGELKLNFPVLSDPGFAVSGRYYVLDSEAPGRSVHFSIIVLDSDRIIRYRVSEHHGYQEFNFERFKSEISGLI